MVTDEPDTAIPGANLKLTDADIGVLVETRSNATGYYHFTLVPVGGWIVCKAENFEQGIANSVRVETAGQVRQDFQLGLGPFMAVAVSTTNEFKAGIPEKLFTLPPSTYVWDVTADGQRFIAIEDAGRPPKAKIQVTMKWFQEFRENQ